MKIHQQKNRVNVVMDIQQLFQITFALSTSPNLKNRLLALEIKQAMDEMNKRAEK